MRIYGLLLCGLLFVNVAISQSFSGKVIDASNGKILVGATVDLPKITTLMTDENGVFITKAREGSFEIRISSIGYRSLVATIQLPAGRKEFSLERMNLFLDPVEIKAVRAGERSPITKTNLGKADIEKNNLGQDLPFLLNQTPSVVINSDAGNGVGYTGIRIRGTDATRINVTLNGIPYNDAESQGTFFVDLPDFSSSVSSIQVQRGVGTSSNGSGAFGASINISTNEFRKDAYAESNNAYGSFNTWKHTIKAGSGLISDHFTIDARLSKVSSSGYIDRANSDLKSFYLSTAYITDKSSLRMNIFSGKEITYQAWNGILQEDLSKNRHYNSAGTEKPGEPYRNETDNYQQDHYQLFYNHQFSPSLSLNSAVFLTRGLGYYEQYKASRKYSDFGLANPIIGNDTIKRTDLVRRLWLDNYYYGAIFSLQYHNANTDLSFGGGGNQLNGKHYGDIIWSQFPVPKDYRWYDLTANKRDLNIYAKWQQHLAPNLESFIDLQYRGVNYEINGFRDNPSIRISETYNFFNPKAGLNYKKNNWHAYLSYAIGNKEPNRDDFESSSETPMPERLHDFEAGLDHKGSRFSWASTIYYMRYKNQLVLTGRINDVGSYTRTNIPNSYRLGLELSGEARLNDIFALSGNLTLSENKVRDFELFVDDYDQGGQKTYAYKKADISFSPAIVGSGNLRVNAWKNGEINATSKYVGLQYLDNTSSKARSLSDFFVQDLTAMHTFKSKFSSQFSVIGRVSNLFNRMYEPNGYTYSYISGNTLTNENYLFPMAGINFMLGVNIQL
ncbi:MAG: TonB-dependent receptor [Chitinophagaceae bacterium]